MEFGVINVCGLIVVVLMLVPNMVYALKAKDAVYRRVNIVIEILEQIGRYSSMILMIFPLGMREFGFPSVADMFVYLMGNVSLLAVYWITWALYFRKRSLKKAMVLAIVPTMIFLVSGIALRHWALIGMAIVFGISHGYITYRNNK